MSDLAIASGLRQLRQRLSTFGAGGFQDCYVAISLATQYIPRISLVWQS